MKFLTIVFFMMVLSLPVQAAEEVCGVLQAHTPSADVAHKGNADMNAQDIVPDVIKVPISVDLAKRVAGLSGKGLQMDAPLGMMEIYQDGRVMYNGQDWTTSVKMLCGQSLREVSVSQEPILNQAPILNKTQILNTAPLNPPKVVLEPGELEKQPVREVVSQVEDGLEQADTIESAPLEAETVIKDVLKERDMIEVSPAVAMPPMDVVDGDPSVNIKAPESDIVEGQDYREIYYNE